MAIESKRTLFVIIGIVLLVTLGGQYENMLPLFYYLLQTMAVVSLLYGGYLWTRIKNIHWGWMFTMLIWPIGLTTLFLIRGNQQMVYKNYVQDPKEMATVDYIQLAGIAKTLNRDGNYKKTIELLTPYVNYNDNRCELLYNELAIAYGKLGSQKNRLKYWSYAYEFHKKAYHINQNNPVNIFNLAMAATWLKKYYEAEELFKRYLESGHHRERQLAIELLDEIRTAR